MLALSAGLFCHSIFILAVAGMMVAMFFGMSRGRGTLPFPWAWLANAALILQFPLGQSLLLTARGRGRLARALPGNHGKTLATTTYAIIASIQLLALFTLWTPTGIVWWRADGLAFLVLCLAYAAAWLFLGLAIFDAGVELQVGGLGWLSLLKNIAPVFPDMPASGLFAWIRQPIYLAFALTLWTVPVWTPDQLALAVCFTLYCVAAPMLKERRFVAIYGDRFRAYRAKVPYMLPYRKRQRDG